MKQNKILRCQSSNFDFFMVLKLQYVGILGLVSFKLGKVINRSCGVTTCLYCVVEVSMLTSANTLFTRKIFELPVQTANCTANLANWLTYE